MNHSHAFVSVSFPGNTWKSFWNNNTPCGEMQAKLQASFEHTHCFIQIHKLHDLCCFFSLKKMQSDMEILCKVIFVHMKHSGTKMSLCMTCHFLLLPHSLSAFKSRLPFLLGSSGFVAGFNDIKMTWCKHKSLHGKLPTRNTGTVNSWAGVESN